MLQNFVLCCDCPSVVIIHLFWVILPREEARCYDEQFSIGDHSIFSERMVIYVFPSVGVSVGVILYYSVFLDVRE